MEELPFENQRIKNLIDRYSNGSELAFSKEINISQPRINRLFNRDARSGKYPLPSFEIIQSIINKFIDVDAEWLLTGKGEMLKKEKIEDSTELTSLYKENRELLKEISLLKDRIIKMQDEQNAVKSPDPKPTRKITHELVKK